MSSCIDLTQSGQGTVEAAFTLPILMLLLLLLLQPGIVLYDRMVMNAAAAEGCRLFATASDSLGSMDSACEAFIRRRLSAIPQQDCFHIHEGSSGCSWNISFSKDESSQTVSVRIEGELRPLPLIDAGARLLGLTNEEGNLVLSVETSLVAQPTWATEILEGKSPDEWIGSWLE